MLQRLFEHAELTARFNIYYGEERDIYDVRGRTVHEAIFNLNDGSFRCPSTQQGYSPFSTWMRGLSWGLTGFAEQLEFLWALRRSKSIAIVPEFFTSAAKATADFYLANSCTDGIPVWDTGAPGLRELGDYPDEPADPFNRLEPVDSSAAAIAAQGLIRFGNVLLGTGDPKMGKHYRQAGLSVANTLFSDDYLAADPRHQGLVLHSVYHRPNGWDFIRPGQTVPNGESSIWGDYHARELALLILREARAEPYPVFFDPTGRLDSPPKGSAREARKQPSQG